ncbi:MAG: winged helix-turn-helix domain-containing protein [Acidobacteriota bacterium]|nr:winged helix-turn-helix domain-containing protein [Acidobacteriota bacterium]
MVSPTQETEHVEPGYRLGRWEVWPRRNQLAGPRGTVHMEPKLMKILLCLIAGKGKVVAKQAILNEVWPSVHVEDRVLARRISELRKLLGDNSREPIYIETVRKGGYRLLMPAEPGLNSPVVEDRSQKPAPLRWLGLAAVVVVAAWVLVSVLRPPAPAAPLDHLTQRLPLTSFPGLEYDPAFSPDSRQLAFSWRQEENPSFDLFIKNLATGKLRQVTSDPGDDRNPVFSPDGRFLAFTRNHPNDRGIYLLELQGDKTQKVAESRLDRIEGLAWSPDGKYLAYPGKNRVFGGQCIMLLHLATRVEKQLTFPHGGGEHDSLPVFSPDGHQLAFRRSGVLLGQVIHTVATAGGPSRQVAGSGASVVGGMDWAADGKSLIYSRFGRTHFNLWTLPLQGDAPQQLPGGDIHAYRPRYSPDGGMLAYMRWTGQSNIWQVDLDGQTGIAGHEPFCASTLWDMAPTWSPEGDRVAFHSNRGGSWQIWVADEVCAEARPITVFQDSSCGNPSWSPTGRMLAFDVRGEGSGIYTIPADGGYPRRITRDEHLNLLPRWSRDGLTIYYTSLREKRWQLFRIPAGVGDRQQPEFFLKMHFLPFSQISQLL